CLFTSSSTAKTGSIPILLLLSIWRINIDPPCPAPTTNVGFFSPEFSIKYFLYTLQKSLEPPINNECIIHVIKYNLRNGFVPVINDTNISVTTIELVTALTTEINSLTLAYSHAR